MENTHDRLPADIAAHENLLESITTEECRRDFAQSPSGVSADTTDQTIISREKDCQYRIPKNRLTCQYRIPKNRLTFLSQIIVLYTVIAVSLYHLSAQSPNQDLWLILLSSAFGYLLPSPGLKYLKPSNSVISRDVASKNDLNAAVTEENKPHGNN